MIFQLVKRMRVELRFLHVIRRIINIKLKKCMNFQLVERMRVEFMFLHVIRWILINIKRTKAYDFSSSETNAC